MRVVSFAMYNIIIYKCERTDGYHEWYLGILPRSVTRPRNARQVEYKRHRNAQMINSCSK